MLVTVLKDKEKNDQMIEEFDMYQRDVSMRAWKMGTLQRVLALFYDLPCPDHICCV